VTQKESNALEWNVQQVEFIFPYFVIQVLRKMRQLFTCTRVQLELNGLHIDAAHHAMPRDGRFYVCVNAHTHKIRSFNDPKRRERRAIFKRVRHKWDTHTRTTALCKTHSEKLVILLDWYSNNEKRSYIYRPVALRRIDFFYSAPHKEMFHSKIIFLHIRQGKCVCLLLDTQQCYSSHTHSRTKLWFCYLLG